MTKVVLIDDHQVILYSLSLLFKSIENVEVVGVLNDSRKLKAFLETESVDIVVSDRTTKEIYVAKYSEWLSDREDGL